MATKRLERIWQMPTRLIMRFLWHPPARRVKILANFAAIEADSSWQLLQAYENFSEPEIKIDLFCQAVEERHHSLLFRKLAQQTAPHAADIPLMERRAIALQGQHPWEWFAFCQAGESEAVQRFRRIAAYLGNTPERKVLRRILRDEARHVHSAAEQADELKIDRRTFGRAVKKAQRKRWGAAWLRQGKKITGLIGQVLLMLTYFLIAPFGTVAARRRFKTVKAKQPAVRESAGSASATIPISSAHSANLSTHWTRQEATP